jgi:hypothetical protein
MPIATGNVTTTAAAVYTSSGNTAVTFLSICNYSAGNITANVYAVPNGGSPGNLNAVLSAIEIASKDTYQLYAGNEKLVLGNGDSLQANANVDNAVTTVTSYYSA